LLVVRWRAITVTGFIKKIVHLGRVHEETSLHLSHSVLYRVVKFYVCGADTYECIRILGVGARNSAQLLTPNDFACLVGGHFGPQNRCANECFIERCPECRECRVGSAHLLTGRCCFSCLFFSHATVDARASRLTQ